MKLELRLDEYLYHGTLDIYANYIKENGVKIINRSTNGVDFGPGFYVTLAEEEQAKVWAKQKAKYPRPIPEALNMLGMTMQDFIVSKNNFKPVIIKFKIKDIEKWKKLNNNIFLEDSLRWREFVWTWRQAYQPPKKYDWIFGPVADGNVNSYDYYSIKAFEGMNQLSIHSDKALELLELVEVEIC